jgi:hypothetical protein
VSPWPRSPGCESRRRVSPRPPAEATLFSLLGTPLKAAKLFAAMWARHKTDHVTLLY